MCFASVATTRVTCESGSVLWPGSDFNSHSHTFNPEPDDHVGYSIVIYHLSNEELIEALGEDGTLAIPAATPQCAELEPLTVFDAETTPTKMGAIAEAFRTWPGTLRSTHPLESVCARGPLAAEITSVQLLDDEAHSKTSRALSTIDVFLTA